MVTKKVMVLAVVVGDNDEPVFLKDLRLAGQKDEGNNIEEYLYHFVLHSALDAVAEKQWQLQLSQTYLGVVDTFREYSVSALVTVSGTKFLLLHRGLSDVNVRTFLKGAYAAWLRIAVNPLNDREESIDSAAFETKMLSISSKFLSSSS